MSSTSITTSAPPDEAILAWALSFARGYLELGMVRQAEQELDRLPAALQDLPAVMSLRSHVLVARRRWRRVVAHARRAVRLFPESPEYYIHAATAFDMLGRREEGRKMFHGHSLIWMSGAWRQPGCPTPCWCLRMVLSNGALCRLPPAGASAAVRRGR